MSNALALYNSACNALTEAKTLLEVKNVANKAAAIKEIARLASDNALEVHAAELHIRAVRELGIWLSGIDLHKGGRPPAETDTDSGLVSGPTLEELEIEPKDSAKAKKLAALPDFEERMNAWRAKTKSGGRITVNLLQEPRKKRQKSADDALNTVIAWWNGTDDAYRQRFFNKIEATFLPSITDAQRRRIFAELTGQAPATRAPNGAQRNVIRDLQRDIGALE